MGGVDHQVPGDFTLRSPKSDQGDGSAPQSPAADAADANQRFASRRQSRTPAHITHASLGQPVTCTVRDSSSTGALVELVQTKGAFSPGADRLPPRFVLTMPTERAAVECEIAWRRGAMMGIRYVAPTRVLAKPARNLPRTEEPKSLMGQVLKKTGFRI